MKGSIHKIQRMFYFTLFFSFILSSIDFSCQFFLLSTLMLYFVDGNTTKKRNLIFFYFQFRLNFFAVLLQYTRRMVTVHTYKKRKRTIFSFASLTTNKKNYNNNNHSVVFRNKKSLIKSFLSFGISSIILI